MVAVNKTIGTATRDYSTITAWDADDGGGDGLGNDDCTGECYDDSTFSESPDIDFVANSILLKPADGQGHDGTVLSGGVTISGAATEVLNLRGTYAGYDATLQDMIVTRSNTTHTTGIDSQITVGGPVITVERCIVHGLENAGASAPTGIDANGNGMTFSCHDNIVYGVEYSGTSSGGTMYPLRIDGASIGGTCNNNTVFKCGVSNAGAGHNVVAVSTDADDAQLSVRNTISVGNYNDGSGTVDDFQTWSTSPNDHNLSSDTSAAGTGSLTSKPAADQFVSIVGGSEDLHLKSGADAIGAGDDLGTTPTGVNLDIDGDDRDALAVTWDIGADQYIAAAPAGNPHWYYAMTGQGAYTPCHSNP